MDMHVDVVVVGAGGGGAILGMLLADKGIRTIVLERAPGPPTGIRGEILQPNGQKILDDLGLLSSLPADAVHPVRHIHFRKIGGRRLCSIDYDDLPPPYNRALVTLPHVAHHAVLTALARRNPDGLWYDASFVNVVTHGSTVTGVDAVVAGAPVRIAAKLVVGADGPLSAVRTALAIPTTIHRYAERYLVAILDSPGGLTDAQYFLGHKELLGLFPAASGKLYLVSMIPAAAEHAVRAAGVSALRERWCAIHPALSDVFRGFHDWTQSAIIPAGRVRTTTWVADGAVLIGDAAHGMNPHASQGRMQAMADAVALADLIPSCLAADDCSAAALAPYERRRRPTVEMLQRLADEEVFFWNTGNPLIAWLRNRVFTTVDRNRRLKYHILTAKAGLRDTPPFTGLADRLRAVGLFPDPAADWRPPHATAVASSTSSSTVAPSTAASLTPSPSPSTAAPSTAASLTPSPSPSTATSPTPLSHFPETLRALLRTILRDIRTHPAPPQAVLVYGSAARGEFLPGVSNVNLLFLIDRATQPALRDWSRFQRRWARANVVTPLLLTADDLRRFPVTFPLDYLSLRTHHVILEGHNPLPDIPVPADRLLADCERELLANLLRVRQCYVEGSGRIEAIHAVLPLSLTSLLSCLHGWHHLLSRPPHSTHAALLTDLPATLDVDPSAFLDVWRMKRGLITPGKHDLPNLLERYLSALNTLSARITTMTQAGKFQ